MRKEDIKLVKDRRPSKCE